MSTITFNSLSASATRSPASFTIPQAVKLRAALPALVVEGGLAARAFTVLSGAALAAVPFAALGWMFIAR